MIWALINRSSLPPPPLPWRRRIAEARRLIPVLLLVAGVIGSIYAGIATPTEAAAIGVLGALLISLATGSLNRETFLQSLLGATRTTCMIGFIVASAGFLTIMMAYTKLPMQLAAWIDPLGLSQTMLIVVLTVFYIVLGCFLEGISIIVLTAAIVLPMIDRAGLDLIWFGIYLVLVVEMALITPPVGFNLFVIQGLSGRSILYVARVAFPFFILLMIGLALIVAFPEIVTWLPSRTGRG
jgi:C4-dicarboxylate transporter, DctM subunit